MNLKPYLLISCLATILSITACGGGDGKDNYSRPDEVVAEDPPA